MNTFSWENNAFIYDNGEKKIVLLDCKDFLSNKSRIPMHRIDNESLTIPELITRLIQKNQDFWQESDVVSQTLEVMILDIITISHLCKSALPVKVLEIGAVDGVVSYNLATLLGKFNPESLLCCVSDTIGNESENQLLDHIVLVEDLPKFSFLASDYHETQLQEKNYDLVIINGTADFTEPYKVALEAKRLVKENGLVICYSLDGLLLESSFKAVFGEREEYPLNGSSNVMVAHQQPDKRAENKINSVYQFIEDTERLMVAADNMDIKKYCDIIEGYLDVSVNCVDIEAKIHLIDLRERLINRYLLCI